MIVNLFKLTVRIDHHRLRSLAQFKQSREVTERLQESGGDAKDMGAGSGGWVVKGGIIRKFRKLHRKKV